MNMEFMGDESGLAAYYNFNEGLPSVSNAGLVTVNDVTNNNNDGTLQNFSLTGLSSNWVGGALGGSSILNDYNGTSDASDTYPVGTTLVTWTATDGFGNTRICTQFINVVEFTPCPAARLGTDPLSISRSEQRDEIGMRVFPNPADEFLQVELNGLTEDTELRVYDLAGRLLHTQWVKGEINSIRLDVSSNRFPAGLVLIQALMEGQMFSERVVIMK